MIANSETLASNRELAARIPGRDTDRSSEKGRGLKETSGPTNDIIRPFQIRAEWLFDSVDGSGDVYAIHVRIALSALLADSAMWAQPYLIINHGR